MNRHTILTVAIFIGLVLGLILGEILYRMSVPAHVLDGFEFVGNTFFMRLLKMVLVPLVASSVLVGVASIGDPSQLGKVGGWTVLYYFATMAAAVVLGVILVATINPGGTFPDDIRQARIEEFESAEGKWSFDCPPPSWAEEYLAKE